MESRDVIFSIALRMDYSTIMNYCLTQKRINEIVCRNHQFWQHKLLRDYGVVRPTNNANNLRQYYKAYDNTYRKLLDKFGFDYNKVKSKPKTTKTFQSLSRYYQRISTSSEANMISNAAIIGDLALVKRYLTDDYGDYDNYSMLMYYAALAGHKHFIDFVISKGGDNWSWGKAGAEEGNHPELVKFFQEKRKP